MNFSVSDDGELPRGLYCYIITSEGNVCHILQIYAKNKNNSIMLSWDAKGGSEFKVFRGPDLQHFEGFFSVYSVANSCFIYDNGLGVLNESKTNPYD